MNNAKIGYFIKELREKKGWTQDELAKRIPVTREAVSKWERGISYPDYSSLIKLSEIFDVSTNELLFGAKKDKDNNKKVEEVALAIYEDRNKNKKKFIISIILLAVITLAFLIYYFYTTFNTFKIYDVGYANENIIIQNGILVATKEKIYFNLGDINSKKKINYLKLYYKDKNEKSKLIIETDSTEINLVDFWGYNAYFDFNKLNDMIKNMYLDITYEDGTETIKIEITKSYANDYIIPEKTNTIGNKPTIPLEYNKEIENKIKQKFNQKNDTYIYIQGKEEYIYFPEDKKIKLTITEKNSTKEWSYCLYFKSLYYQEYNDKKTLNHFFYDNKKVTCYTDICISEKEIINFFNDKLNHLLY